MASNIVHFFFFCSRSVRDGQAGGWQSTWWTDVAGTALSCPRGPKQKKERDHFNSVAESVVVVVHVGEDTDVTSTTTENSILGLLSTLLEWTLRNLRAHSS